MCRGPRRRRDRLRRGPIRAGAVHAGTASPSTTSCAPGSVGSSVAPGSRRPSGGRSRSAPIVTAMRQFARSAEIAELSIRYRDDGVVGFDIAGPEAGFPPSRHLDAFQLIHRANFHVTIHAGEAFGLPSIWEALQWCGAERLGHGVRIVDDMRTQPDGTIELGRLAQYVRDRRVPLEMCPTSNVHTGAVASIGDHPIDLLRRLRFRVTVNTDNRLMSGVTLSDEFGRLTRDLRLRPRRDAVAHDERDEELVPGRSTSGCASSTASSSPATRASWPRHRPRHRRSSRRRRQAASSRTASGSSIHRTVVPHSRQRKGASSRSSPTSCAPCSTSHQGQAIVRHRWVLRLSRSSTGAHEAPCGSRVPSLVTHIPARREPAASLRWSADAHGKTRKDPRSGTLSDWRTSPSGPVSLAPPG